MLEQTVRHSSLGPVIERVMYISRLSNVEIIPRVISPLNLAHHGQHLSREQHDQILKHAEPSVSTFDTEQLR